MTTKAAFSAEEWKDLTEAPLAMSLYIVLAAPSLFGSLGETFAATRQLVEGAQTATGNELLDAILAEFKELGTARAAQPDLEGRDPTAIKQQLHGLVSRAVSVLDQKATPAEATAIKQWLYGLAQKTADASKEGGFLGIGGVRVSEEEMAALRELAGLLGVSA